MKKRGEGVPAETAAAVLLRSENLPKDAPIVRGYDFEDKQVNYAQLLRCNATTGFQASHFAQAVDIVNEMIDWEPTKSMIEEGIDPNTKCKIFLGYTSGMVSSGVRETIKFLVKHKMVDILVSTGGGVEEDLMKCIAPTAVGEFSLCGAELRKRGLNRIGNLLVPNNNYCALQDWLLPILDEALDSQTTKGEVYSPSKLIRLFGQRIAHEDSICYWAARNNIPIFCPAITDGAIGDVIFFHSYKNPGFILDLVHDICEINRAAISAKCSGMIILGGGVVKHHIANANLMRNGADFTVYINTAQEFDGSDAGASTDEAVSWGKIKVAAKKVKVCTDATLVFPLLVAQTFAQHKDKYVKTSIVENDHGGD